MQEPALLQLLKVTTLGFMLCVFGTFEVVLGKEIQLLSSDWSISHELYDMF